MSQTSKANQRTRGLEDLQPKEQETFVKANKKTINPKTIALAASLAAIQIGTAYAQSNGLNLDEVVVTASPTGRTKMKSSDSVTSVGEEAITRSGATNAAEILRSVPGIRAESSGGEGNANVTVRGAPVSAGGGRYVQFQEDGLPVMLFGDIAFGTPDQFLRTDFTTDRVEVVRGGSASTLASNAPGGIVNFVSKTGRDAGNAVGVTTGVGSRLNRYDFNFGSTLSTDTYFNVGGFTRQGEGAPYNTGFNSQDGGQFKASITKELDKGSYVRLNFKNLDDKTPTILPVPTRVVNGQIQTVSGVDPRNAFFINPNITRDTTIDRNGNQVSTNPADGLHVTSRSIGLEAKINLDGGWTVEERMRKTTNGGRFVGMFPANTVSNNSFTGTMFNTSLDNMDNMFNDLKASKPFEMNGGKSVFTGGLFTGSQNVAQTWFWNQYTVGTNGSWSSPVSSGWNTWGNCCARTYDVKYNVTAPYAALSWEKDKLTVEGSVRQNQMSATGQSFKGTVPTNATSLAAGSWDAASADTVNYKQSKASYSVGANYAVTKDTALYTRVSDGYNFAADRLLYGTAGALNGSKPVSFNRLQQQEVGVKHREGNLSLFGTFFMAQTDESNYEATTQKFTTNGYDAKGIELEAAYRSGAFRLSGGATYTDAKIKSTAPADAANIGNTPRRQAKWVYALSPSYKTGDLEYGAAFIGTTKSYGDDANTITMGGYVITNLFANYRINKQASAIFSVNNALNKLAYTEVEGDGHAARALAGRTAKATVKYEF
jgi:outer membrane receptor protein involved in Fe transport